MVDTVKYQFECPKCHRRIAVKGTKHVGAVKSCPACKTSFIVPSPGEVCQLADAAPLPDNTPAPNQDHSAADAKEDTGSPFDSVPSFQEVAEPVILKTPVVQPQTVTRVADPKTEAKADQNADEKKDQRNPPWILIGSLAGSVALIGAIIMVMLFWQGDDVGTPMAVGELPTDGITPATNVTAEPSLPLPLTSELIEQTKAIFFAMQNFADTHQSYPLPGGNTVPRVAMHPDLSWRVAVLPYLDEMPLYERFHLDEPWDSPHNQPLLKEMPEVFDVPVMGLPPGMTTVQYAAGGWTLWGVDADTQGLQPRMVLDGLRNTIAVIIAGPETAVPWTKPGDLSLARGRGPSQLGEPILRVADQVGWPAIMFDLPAQFLPASTTNKHLDLYVGHADGPDPGDLPELEQLPALLKSNTSSTGNNATTIGTPPPLPSLATLDIGNVRRFQTDPDRLRPSRMIAWYADQVDNASDGEERQKMASNARYLFPAAFGVVPEHDEFMLPVKEAWERSQENPEETVPTEFTDERFRDRRKIIPLLVDAIFRLCEDNDLKPIQYTYGMIGESINGGFTIELVEEPILHTLLIEWRSRVLQRYGVQPAEGALEKVAVKLKEDKHGEPIRRFEAFFFGPLAIGEPDMMAMSHDSFYDVLIKQ